MRENLRFQLKLIQMLVRITIYDVIEWNDWEQNILLSKINNRSLRIVMLLWNFRLMSWFKEINNGSMNDTLHQYLLNLWHVDFYYQLFHFQSQSQSRAFYNSENATMSNNGKISLEFEEATSLSKEAWAVDYVKSELLWSK